MTRQLSVLRAHGDQEIPVSGKYTIDAAHTSVELVGRHLMITKVRGLFPHVSGSITIDEDPARSHVEAEIEVGSLETGDPQRDAHLRSADFFDAERFPTMTFRSSQVEAGPGGTWNVTGDLTVRDVTRPLTLEVDFDGANLSPMGDERIAFSAAADVDREEWGLTWNVGLETGGWLVGKRVRIELNVQAVAARPS
jgi:polyisoprenoid-binding protein YceI